MLRLVFFDCYQFFCLLLRGLWGSRLQMVGSLHSSLAPSLSFTVNMSVAFLLQGTVLTCLFTCLFVCTCVCLLACMSVNVSACVFQLPGHMQGTILTDLSPGTTTICKWATACTVSTGRGQFLALPYLNSKINHWQYCDRLPSI